MTPWRGLSPLTTLGDDQSLERIITSPFPGGWSVPGEDYHLSLPRGMISPWRGLSPLTSLGDYQPLESESPRSRGLSPQSNYLGGWSALESIITSLHVDFGLLPSFLKKSAVLSMFGVLYQFVLFSSIILVKFFAFIRLKVMVWLH